MPQTSYKDIELAAEDFLKRHNPDRKIPVPIENIVEIQLHISIVPKQNLRSHHQIDAFLSSDLTELYIDFDDYMNETNRGRFSLAHEMGHCVLHSSVVKTVASIDAWKQRVLGDGSGRAILENEANDFAGCVLMPRAELLAEYKSQSAKANKAFADLGMKLDDVRTLNSYVAVSLAKTFAVSQQAAEIRLNKVLNSPK